MNNLRYFIILLLLVIIATSISISQKLGKIPDSTLVFKEYYAGIMLRQAYNLPKFGSEIEANLRLAVKTITPVEIDNIDLGKIYGNFAYDFKRVFSHLYFGKRINGFGLYLGSPPRPIAGLIRPSPMTADGQFEPRVTQILPGTANGGYLEYKSARNTLFQMGLYQSPENHLEFDWGLCQQNNDMEYKLAWYSSIDESGLALSWKDSVTELKIASAGDKRSFFTQFLVGKDLKTFFDYVFDQKIDRTEHTEIGLIKEFNLEYITSLLGISYQYPNNQIAVYLFVHL
ncbi:MAG: hypothetical protein ABIJ81_02520 [Patescibacteria group bacterium]